MDNVLTEALVRALAVGTPLLLACLGAILNERAGVVNLGVEGLMAVGALAAFAVAAGSPDANLWLAVGAAMLAGAALALLHAIATVTLRANQFVSGLALALIGTGAAGLLGKRFEGLPLFNKVADWNLGGFTISPFTVAALLLAGAMAFWLGATRSGLGVLLPADSYNVSEDEGSWIGVGSTESLAEAVADPPPPFPLPFTQSPYLVQCLRSLSLLGTSQSLAAPGALAGVCGRGSAGLLAG